MSSMLKKRITRVEWDYRREYIVWEYGKEKLAVEKLET